MGDQILLHDGKAVVITEEGRRIERPESDFTDMMRRETHPPLEGAAWPDGVKFWDWCDPLFLVVHQQPPCVRQLRWIAKNSPSKFGRGTKYRKLSLSIPYAITFAVFYCRGTGFFPTYYNELYFSNRPLLKETDRIGYPALLNISVIPAANRQRAWICTHKHTPPETGDWTRQLAALLDHTWNGGFNLSSEHHEGRSWYGASKGIHPMLHPVEKWAEATRSDASCGLGVPWKPVPMNVRDLMTSVLDECHQDPSRLRVEESIFRKPASLVSRFLNFTQGANTNAAEA